MEQKESYKGLTTRRFEVESSPIMATSDATLKVKTQVNSSNEEWVEESPSKALETSISSEVF